MSSLPYKNILLGVSGGIAAYKIPFLVRLLKKRGHHVRVVLTENARPLVGVDALKTVSGSPVYTDITDDSHDMGHIRLEEWADLYMVVPATANTIGKMAHGIADNLLTTLALSVSSPVVVVPAMNTNMWEHAAVKDNVAILKSRGVTLLPVGCGELACGVVGAGRMIEPEDIVEYISLIGKAVELAGKKVLITSGPTAEPVDGVRLLTNSSTGRMGAALARAAILGGAQVLFVTGKAEVPPPAGCEVIKVTTALEMKAVVENYMAEMDIFVMAAAVSDFRMAEQRSGKIDRHGVEELQLTLVKNPDIAAMVGSAKSEKQKLVTFSLESSDADLERAREKMVRKAADLTVFNRVEDSLGTATTSIVLLTKEGQESIEFVDKTEAAAEIFRAVLAL